ncbi:TadE family protein [Glycomyces buryatensis]|uniref:Pilus assembly protein n=1 Tax=Glycomyces buryatensis TaxID=2570927 RepID=A0A4S8PVT4_9ACTN|nr:TadE family protein [Glycomyces buryatensis]THV35680.1 pilus assembly protein [Glycomyces buryatensis]
MTRIDKPPDGADEGSATVELVIATPALMLMLLIVVQAGLWGIAAYTAHAAAGEAVTALRTADGTADDAATVALESVNDLGGGLNGLDITTGRDDASATVTLSGTAVELIPGLTLPVTVTQTAPVEAEFETEPA